ncbi:rhodanese-like domain-containing protein [Aureibaculum marinum]|uniref:Rhodanese-like domain-containing protein n=1 Tax=Aureibaculum marinum TaxID=2487930 RepID=A0A3N4NW38_9FLAO|nr:rhodanese-like domain-containing protein [Aureibaculum marinum]RPD96420.1 rhodanese-like domain-containing protein [Aureibaculum marinum]
MKNLPISLFIVIALLFSCKNNSQNTDKNATIEVVNATDFKAKIDNAKEVQLVDVRTPKEYNTSHLKNAKNINIFDADFLTKMNTLDKSKPVYVYCKSGKRSSNAAKKLKEAGFTKIYDLNGGILAWTKENLETN